MYSIFLTLTIETSSPKANSLNVLFLHCIMRVETSWAQMTHCEEIDFVH